MTTRPGHSFGVTLPAMFCPQCRVEYRPGFTHCTDCDVNLVDALPQESERAGQANRIIWMGDSQESCVLLCQHLKDTGIPYQVRQGMKSRSGMSVTWKYELSVPAEDEKRSKELLELPETVVQESSEWRHEDEDQALMELPVGDESAPGTVRKGKSYLGPWYPEDATVEVFTESPTFESGLIEMSLKENEIRARVEVQEDGFKKVFVLPEDEAAAKEIVREIVEDSPLE
ncbi:MAG TPA: hypothetical protein VJN92_03600 [Candidatus Acidoferrum sp.]|nr:hypothetical protein [Candidatus Acidoferrum sp.]